MAPGADAEDTKNVFTTVPPQPAEKKQGQLSEEMIKRYFEEGVILIEDFFTKEELEEVKTCINGLVEDLAQKLYKGGKIKNLYQEYGFYERLSHIEKEWPGANILLHKIGKIPPAFRDIWTNERLLNVVEQLIGPDIMGHPVWNLRTKTPNNEATVVPWHQDTAYMDVEDASKALQVTAWIPLIDANLQNGCMEMAKRGHRAGKVGTHTCCYAGTWYVMIEPDEMKRSLGVDPEDCKVMPVPYGGLLLFNNMIPHRSLPNYSNNVRWSLDLRWQSPHYPHGFHLKDGVVFRDTKDPNHKIDWETFDSVDRNAEQNKSMGMVSESIADEFDTTITGPWMKKWKIVNHNRHVAAMTDDKNTWTKA